jgi:hypothetical protein
MKLQIPCCTQSTILASDLAVQAAYGSSRRAEKVTKRSIWLFAWRHAIMSPPSKKGFSAACGAGFFPGDDK